MSFGFPDVDGHEVNVLCSGLCREQAAVARQRSITECRLAAGEGDAAVLTRLAYYEECDLATIDGLLIKLGRA